MTGPIRPQEEPHLPPIELRGFMDLVGFFRERGWGNPMQVDVPGEITGTQLIEMLGIPPEMVEVVFVNGKASRPSLAMLTGGDRVALAPPGVPGPYRVLLGFKNTG